MPNRRIDSVLKNGIVFFLFPLTFSCTENISKESSEIKVETVYYQDSLLNEIVQKKNGLLDGKCFKFNKNGTKHWEFHFASDKQEGLQYYYVDGKLNFEVTYRNGQRHGWAKRFTGPCGSISEEGQYANDSRNGLWYEYYNRELLEVTLYSNDTLVKSVYRNQKYPDRSTPLPPIVTDCNEVWMSGEE